MLPSFRLESYFAQWEFRARHHLTAADVETMSLSDLLSLGSDDDRESFLRLELGYAEPQGGPVLRDEIARTYEHRTPEDILCFAGAEEGIFATLRTLLDADSHAIVVLPAYQSLEAVPMSVCDVTGIALDRDRGWALDLEQVTDAIRPNTRALIINFPHNPTGSLLPEADLRQLITICDRAGIWLFSDEAYRPLGPVGGRQLPQVADLYERGISLGVTSKALGLPGLRIGWTACADRRLLERVAQLKHYLSICNAVPSEFLAVVALRARETILKRNRRIVSDNIGLWQGFFDRHGGLFDWLPPAAGCVCYPRYRGEDGVEAFARDLVNKAGVLVLPASIFASDRCGLPVDHFRIGAGRLGTADGIAALDAFLAARSR